MVCRAPVIDASCKFQDDQTSGSGKEDFQRFLSYMGMAAILVM